MTAAATHVAIYLRQSEDRDGDMLAVDRHREDCEKLCANRGWTWTEYMDNDRGASGQMPDSRRRAVKPRPAYEQMVADIKAGRIDGIVAWDADRLIRQVRELEDVIDLADEYGIALATIGGEFDLSTPTGRGNARMKGVWARMEMEQKAYRQKRAAKQKAERGLPNWATTPFGYAKGDGGTLRINPDEAILVRDAYAAILAGMSLHSVAKDWNSRRVTTRRGKPWTGATIRQLLLAYRNVGLRTYSGEMVRTPGEKRKPVEQIVGDAKWAAIVERDVFDAVRAILTQPGRRVGGTSSARKHLLTGLAVCGKCGKPVGSLTGTNGRPVYGCKQPDCFGVSRDMERLDAYINDVVIERLSRPDAGELLMDADRTDLVELREQAAALRVREDEAAVMFANGQIGSEQLRTITANLEAQLAAIEPRLFSANRTRVFDGVIGAKDIAKAYEKLPLDRKRAVIDALVTVTILPVRGATKFRTDTVTVDWR